MEDSLTEENLDHSLRDPEGDARISPTNAWEARKTNRSASVSASKAKVQVESGTWLFRCYFESSKPYNILLRWVPRSTNIEIFSML